jgi:hypothetical protein
MGRELFDFAFKEYCRRWAFKHPTPADFFRTMEDASSVDLDWFWRGWFYTTDHVDLAIDQVRWFQIDTRDPEIEAEFRREAQARKPQDISLIRDMEGIPETYLERDPSLHDFYTETDPFMVWELDKKEYRDFVADLSPEDLALMQSGKNYYEITFRDEGGLIMPLILKFEYEDGSEEIRRIPAEIWKMSEPTVTKVFVTERPVVRIVLDPFLETADVDPSDNAWPPRPEPTRFQLQKERQQRAEENALQRARRSEALDGE